MSANDEANVNVTVKKSDSFTEQAAQVSWLRVITVLQPTKAEWNEPRTSANVRCKFGDCICHFDLYRHL